MSQGRDWIVTQDGHCQACSTPREWELLETPYHFHRFLTQVEDALEVPCDELDCLVTVRYLVRKLVLNNYWIQTQYPDLETLTDIVVRNLYDEIGYPLTVQTTTSPTGTVSSIHNHGTWGVVALIKGQEKDTFWKHTPTPDFPGQITYAGERVFNPGDIISFTPGAIHCIENIGDGPMMTFHVYGETQSKARFEFDLDTRKAKNY